MNIRSKICNGLMLALLAVCIAVPVALLNTEPRSFSEPDNRYCVEWPEGEDLTFTEWAAGVDAYVSDRIGLRKQMMSLYMKGNDEAFGILDHPDFDYGTNGYLFHSFDFYVADDEYVTLYANYIVQMQQYCQQRGIPFLYVNTPSKEFVYSEYIPDDMPMKHNIFEVIEPILQDAEVEYLDLTETLVQAKESGHQVFNVFYDPGHWNTEGAFIGSNAILAKLAEMGIDVEQCDFKDYNVDKVFVEYQTSSVYPINKYFDRYVHKQDGSEAVRLPEYEDALEVNEWAPQRYIWQNESLEDGANLLMFQGSYFNNEGTSLYNQFNRANLVHDYLNVMNLAYYIDVFQPDVVIFESADYAVRDGYYNEWDLTYADLPPVFADTYDSSWFYWGYAPVEEITFAADAAIANLSIPYDTSCVEYAYVEIDGVMYDCVVRDEDIHWGVDAKYLSESQEAQVYIVGYGGPMETFTVQITAEEPPRFRRYCPKKFLLFP